LKKNKIGKKLLVISPCCCAPSTSMNGAYGLEPNPNQRCVRCGQVFCRIDVDDSRKPPLRAAVGARA
jgi:hypothetical protein